MRGVVPASLVLLFVMVAGLRLALPERRASRWFARVALPAALVLRLEGASRRSLVWLACLTV